MWRKLGLNIQKQSLLDALVYHERTPLRLWLSRGFLLCLAVQPVERHLQKGLSLLDGFYLVRFRMLTVSTWNVWGNKSTGVAFTSS